MHALNKLHQNVGFGKREYDVVLWRQEQHVYSNNNHHMPLLKTRIW